MMLKQAIVAVAIVAMGLVSAQDNPTAPSACAASCVSGVFSNAASVGCANGDTLCVCGKTESLQDGIRDCIDAACPNDVPGVQIPLAIAYGNQICAQEAAASISSTESLPTPSPSTAAAASTTVPASTSTTAPVPSVESTSQSTISSTEVANTATSSSEVNNQATAAPVSLSTASESSTATETSTASEISTASETSTASESLATSESSSPTISDTSQATATATSGATTASSGTSTAVKAGIGAGVGAASLAAIIIAVCVLVRRRQRKKTANRVRKYKISEPMSGSGRQFGDDIGRAESGLPTPIITTRPAYADSPGLATSPTSLYSNSSELETNARRYEDMQPRTQPRTMI